MDSEGFFKAGQKDPRLVCPKVCVQELKAEKFILQSTEQRTRQVADKLFEEAGYTPEILLVTRSVESMLQLVSSCLGICIVAKIHAMHSTLENPVAYYAVDDPRATITILLTHMRNAYQPVYFKEFVKIVQRQRF